MARKKQYSDPLLKGVGLFLIVELLFILYQLSDFFWNSFKKTRVVKEIIRFYHSFKTKTNHEVH